LFILANTAGCPPNVQFLIASLQPLFFNSHKINV